MHYVNKRMVAAINSLVMTRTGGARFSNTNLRPGQTLGFVERIHVNEIFGVPIYPTLYHQAAAYMYYIIKNHVFHDGNKRTGLATAITFLQWNHVQLHPLAEDPVFDFVVDVAAGTAPPEEEIPRIARWLQRLAQQGPGDGDVGATPPAEY